MKQKNTLNSLNIESKAIDILKDSDFLRLFKYFILIYWENKKNDSNISILFTNFSRKDFLEYFKNKNDYNLFNQFYKFFSDDLNKIVFFDTIREFEIDEKKLNLFLNIWEYLKEVWDKSNEYPKWFYNISQEYKKWVWEIIKNRDINDTSSLLLKEWYSNISPFNTIITDCDFWNSINYNSLDWEYSFIWCVDEEKNIFYQNKSWEILRDSNNKIITHIDVSSIKYFGDYRIYSFINEDWEWKIQIENSLSLGVSFESNIFGDSFNVKEVSYNEEVLWDDWKIINNEEKLEYLLVNNGEERRLLNKNLQDICILDVIEFLHKNNPLIQNELEKNLGELWDILVHNINKIYNYSWVKFFELEAEIDLALWYEKTDIEPEIKHFILLDNWKPLTYGNKFEENYIHSLWETKFFLGKEFVSFTLFDKWEVIWYIDSFWKVVEINWEELFSIDFLSEINWKKVYAINKGEYKISNKNLILTEGELSNQLNKYEWFNENKFEILVNWENLITLDEIDLKIKEILWNKI